jgi:hypothetical protein
MGTFVIVKDWVVLQDEKKKRNGAKHKQNSRGKPGSVFFSSDTGRLIHPLTIT